ncbi:MAG: hypothetical protein AB7G06_06720 [Bdellovibrionales bacterium]
MFRKPDIVIAITDVKIALYQGDSAAPVAELANTVEHVATSLQELLERAGARSAIIMLETSDVHLVTETLPRTGWYDQRKLVARRVDLMFPNTELRTAIPLDETTDSKQNYFFVAVPNAPVLTAIYNALARAQCWLVGVTVFAAEFWGHTQHAAHKNRITLLNMGTHVRLLAEEPRTLALTRMLPASVAGNTMLAEQELQTTQSYLLRRGWAATEKPALRTYNVSAVTPFAANNKLPHEILDRQPAPWRTVIGFLLRGQKPFCLLRPARLRQRQQWLRVNDLMQTSLRAAVVLALLMLAVDAGLQMYLQKRNIGLERQLAMLPPPTPGLERIQEASLYWQRHNHDIFEVLKPLSDTLPAPAYLTDLSWTAQPGQAPTLDMTVQNLPASEQSAFMARLVETTGMLATINVSGSQSTGQLGKTETSSAAPILVHLEGTP